MKAYGEVEVALHPVLTSAIDGMSCERHASAALFPGNNPGPPANWRLGGPQGRSGYFGEEGIPRERCESSGC